MLVLLDKRTPTTVDRPIQVAIAIAAVLMMNAAAMATRCPRECRKLFAEQAKTCKAPCPERKAGKECRSACVATRKANRKTCKASVDPLPPLCGLPPPTTSTTSTTTSTTIGPITTTSTTIAPSTTSTTVSPTTTSTSVPPTTTSTTTSTTTTSSTTIPGCLPGSCSCGTDPDGCGGVSGCVCRFVALDPPASGGGSCAAPDYNTIQAAVDAASAGDAIVICPGAYNLTAPVSVPVDLSFLGSGQANTVIDGSNGGSGVQLFKGPTCDRCRPGCESLGHRQRLQPQRCLQALRHLRGWRHLR